MIAEAQARRAHIEDHLTGIEHAVEPPAKAARAPGRTQRAAR